MGNTKSGVQLIDKLSEQLPASTGSYLKQYFQTVPDWILSSLQLMKLKKDTIFLREEEPVETIYILISGMVKAIDYRFYGNTYDYMWFYPVTSFGGMEVLLEQDHYQTTLSTMTPCTMLLIPSTLFQQWINSDIRVLAMEARIMGTFLLEEVKRERIFLFMQGSDRLIYTLLHIYEQTASQNSCIITLTQQNLADSTGLSVKTISRSLKELEHSKQISRIGNRLLITQEQYQLLNEMIRKKYE